MPKTSRPEIYKMVLDLADKHNIKIPYCSYKYTTTQYWRRQYFLICVDIVHRCMLKKVILKRFGIYEAIHILKFQVSQT